MKQWAVKKTDNSIYTFQCEGSPDDFLQDPTDTLLNEITDSNPMPSKSQRAAWKDDGSGDIEVDLTLAKADKKTSCKDERDVKIKNWDEVEQEYTSKISRGTRLSEDVSAEQTNLDAIEDYKHNLRELGATIDTEVDAETTVEDVDDYEPTWPTEPTL